MPSFADDFSDLLDGFIGAYESLLTAVADHRTAVRGADGNGIAAAAERQSRLHTSISALDRRRRELVVAACSTCAELAGVHPSTVTMRDLAGAAPAAVRPSLSARAERLRELVRRVHEDTRTIRAATESVLAHLEGLMRQVGRQLSHAGTYTRRGFVEPGGVVVSAVDVRM
jgi:hypothetical protein